MAVYGNYMTDGDGDVLDITKGKLPIVEGRIYELINGNHYFYSQPISLGTDAVANYVIETGAKANRIEFSLDSTVSGYSFATYEDIIADDDGTLITAINANRVSTNTPVSTLRYNPSNVSIVGATNLRTATVGADGNAQARLSGTITEAFGMILKPNSKYLLRITNMATANIVNVKINWNEEQ